MLEIDSSGVVTATGNLEKFSEKARKAESSSSSLNDVFSQISPTALMASAGVLSLYKAFSSLINSVSNFSKKSVSTYSSFEQIESGLQGVMKSAEKGSAMFERLRAFSFDTTFGVDTLANASTQLLNVGVSAEDLETKLLQLGNVAGGDTNKFNELVSIYAKINNTGKAGAEQLQQLALRQVPIYQYLKKIGVQGTATADDVSKAFELMTAKGEQFNGAMDRINNTISGKEGFVSDTWREFLTSFAEASGLADTYKSILDVVKESLQNVVDWLAKINANPVYQAIFRGVLVGTLTAIVGIIGVTLVKALMAVIVKLGIIVALKSALDPTTLIAVAVGGIAGITAGLVSIQNKNKDVADSYDTVADSIEHARQSQENYNKYVSSGDLETYSSDELKNYTQELSDLTEQKKQLQTYLNGKTGLEKQTMQFGGYKNLTYQSSDGKKHSLEKGSVEEYDKAIKETKATIDEINKVQDEIEKKKQGKSLLDSMWNSVVGDDISTKINDYQTKIDKLKEYKKGFVSDTDKELRLDNGRTIADYFTLSNEDKAKVDETIKYIQKLQNELNFKQALESGDWRAVFENITGTKAYFNNDSASTLGNNTVDTLKKQMKTQADLNEKLYGKDTEKYKEAMESLNKEFQSKIEDILQKLQENGFDVNSTDGRNGVIQPLLDLFKSLDITGVIKDSTTTLKEAFKQGLASYSSEMKSEGLSSGDYGMALGGTALEGVNNITQGTDVGNFIDATMKAGDPLLALLVVLVEDVMDLVSFLGDLTALLSPIKTLLTPFKPLLKMLFMPLAGLNKLLLMLADQLDKFVDWLLNLMGTSTEEVNAVWAELTDNGDTLAETLKAITDQLKSYSEALDEQEQYYAKMKKQLNSETVYEQLGMKDVNDVIITPNGSYNTNPNDTIIASKNPSSLGNRSMNVTINNTTSNTVDTSTTQDDYGNLIVTISKKVAGDMATGKNGWDNAMSYRNNRLSGKRITT